MATKITGKTMAKNISLSVIVQLVSLSVSFILNFAIPKYIDEFQYSYWQSFVLYLGYVGILHFGMLDGIVLRYSQYDYIELDKKKLRSQFIILLLSACLIASIGIFYALLLCSNVVRNIIIFVCLGIITKLVFAYNSYSFQITNRINKYAILILFQRICYGFLVVTLLVLKVNRFEWYCIADLAGDIIGIIVASFYNRGLYFGSLPSFKDSVKEWKTNVASGILLMLANWSAILLLSSAKLIVQWRWDTIVFGKVAFSFSVSNLFLTFVTAISIVLFPALKRMDKDKLPEIYHKIRGVLSPVLLYSLVLYYPGCEIIKRILPKYADSLVYLGILLPIIIYTAKVNLLTNNYLKAYRKEKKMLLINLFSVLVAFGLFYISAYVFNSLTYVLLCIVFSVAMNSVLSEIVVMKIINSKYYRDFFAEILLTITFVVVTALLPTIYAMLLYVLGLVLYSLVFKKNTIQIIKMLGVVFQKHPSNKP